MSPKERLVELIASRAYREGNYVLSSGKASTFYLDAKQITYLPEAVSLVGKAFFEIAKRYNATAVGGKTMGADPIVAAVAAESHRQHCSIPGFVVRKEPKRHGLQKWIEGIAPEGSVAIVDDVITSGASIMDAVRACEAVGCEVAVIATLVDRQEGGREFIETSGYKFETVCTLDEIREFSHNGSLTGVAS